MKKFLISTAALALFSSAAIAADLPTIEAAPIVAPVETVFSWTGFYAGLDAGWIWNESDGWVAGGFAGYNFQQDSIVFGAEADLEWANVDSDDDDADVDWQGSLRGRAGFAVDQFLLYGTAGLAFADLDEDGGDDDDGDWEFGWTAGGGADVAVTDNVFLRGEYRYADYGDDYDSHTSRAGVALKF